ncbi:transposase-like protein [Rhizobium leguminosarum]|uniref:DDE domain family protein n=1 Tax=Rhizobium leguminosarum TaxID=384 RepID=A0A2Z4YU60_RHILE|nr:DDE domain family protein [Rhizobium leguminosarum]
MEHCCIDQTLDEATLSTAFFMQRAGDKWHLDECVVAINGKKQWLWRAVDQDGFVLDVLVQSRRNAKAAKRLMRKLLKAQGRTPRVMITDKLRSYDAARRDLMPGVEHRSHKGLNNRAENSHSRPDDAKGP